jgi:hypothetical protein
MHKQKSLVPSVWQDVTAIAGLYQSILTLMTRRIRYGPDWPSTDIVDCPPPPDFEHAETRELIGAGRR